MPTRRQVYLLDTRSLGVQGQSKATSALTVQERLRGAVQRARYNNENLDRNALEVYAPHQQQSSATSTERSTFTAEPGQPSWGRFLPVELCGEASLQDCGGAQGRGLRRAGRAVSQRLQYFSSSCSAGDKGLPSPFPGAWERRVGVGGP